MTRDLFPPDAIQFASTRSDALQQLQEFVPFAGRYSRHRNHVLPGHQKKKRNDFKIIPRLCTSGQNISQRNKADVDDFVLQNVFLIQ